MKTIIAGTRTLTNFDLVNKAVAIAKKHNIKITKVISGGAPGIDKLGERYSKREKLPLRRIEAQWNKYREAAGPIRNLEMARIADALIAIWDGKSMGTANMIRITQKMG